MLKASNLHVYYGAIHAIKDVSFHVDKGEIVTLIGANGAGKSTILNTISGLLRPRVGSVEFMDKNITGMAPHKIVRSHLVQVPEGRKIFAEMTVQENLEIGAYAIRFTATSRALKSAASSLRVRFRAASSRCWPWAAH